MKIFKLFSLILINTYFNQTGAGKLWPLGRFKMPHPQNKVKEREIRASDPILAVDVLLGDKVSSEFSKIAGDPYLSDAIEHMDAPSLLRLLGKLKEEYVAKAGREDAERVRSSFDRLMTTLVTLSNGAKRSHSGPAEILDLLSEEELEDESSMYGSNYYDVYSDEDSDPSLLELQAWNRKLGNKDSWVW